MFGIDHEPLAARIDDEVHRLERQHAHQRLVAKQQRCGGIGAVGEGNFDGTNFWDFDLASVREGEDLRHAFFEIEPKLARLRLRHAHMHGPGIDEGRDFNAGLLEYVGELQVRSRKAHDAAPVFIHYALCGTVTPSR